MNRYRTTFFLLLLFSTTSQAASFSAVTDWSQRAVLGTPVSGVISTVDVVPGQRVAQGQLLLQYDQRPFDSEVRNKQAAQRKFALGRDEARRERDRTRELYERTVISKHDLQLQEIAFAVAEADFSSAQAALEKALLHQEYSRLHAPFAGVVLAVQVTPGMTVVNTEQATPLVTLAQDRPMHVHLQLTRAELANLPEDGKASVSLRGKRHAATRVQTAAEPDEQGLYRVTFAFDPGDESMQVGMPVELQLE